MDTLEQGCKKCRFQPFTLTLALAIITFSLYLPTVRFDFVHLDDFHYVAENPFIENGLCLRNLLGAFTTAFHSNWHPVTWLSYLLDYELFGLNPGGYHLTNVLFHTINSILLFLVLRSMTAATWKSFLAAALFAWHPLHVESVAWISERKDVLFTFFWILTMWSHWRYANKPCAKRNLLTLLFCVLALMAKPMAVTLPVVLLLMDIWPLQRFPKPIESDGSYKQQAGKLLLEKMTLFIAVLFTCILTFRAQQLSGAVKSLEHLPLLPRITNTFIAYISYLRMMVWPVNLAIIYPHSHQLRIGIAVISTVILLTITLWALAVRKKYPFFAVGWLWYIITLIPVIGIIQVGVQSLADRYTYVPLIGIFVVIAWGAEAISVKRSFLKPAVCLGVCLILAGCLYLTRLQIFRWKDSLTLFTHTLSVTEKNWKAHSALGCWYFEEEDYSRAKQQITKAIDINPKNEALRIRYGNTFAKQGNFEKALQEYHKALEVNPESSTAYYCLGKLYGEQGNPEEMLRCYRKALSIVPGSRKAKKLIAWTLSTDPNEQIRNGQEALELCEKLSLFEKPDAEHLCVWAAAYAEVGQFKEAVLTAEKALKKARKEKNSNNELIQKIDDCLRQYKQGQAYRDTSPIID